MTINVNFGEWQGIDMRDPAALTDLMREDFVEGSYFPDSQVNNPPGTVELWSPYPHLAFIEFHGSFATEGEGETQSVVGTVDAFVMYNDADWPLEEPEPLNFRILVTGLDTSLAGVLEALNTDITTLFDGESLTIFGSLAYGDVLVGGDLSDLIAGFGGRDTLIGGGGDDILNGGLGKDVLRGSAGADVFTFGNVAVKAANADVIKDFKHLVDDIALHKTKMGALGAGTGALAPDKFYKHAGVDANGAGDAEDRILYDTTSGKLWYDADGSGTLKSPVLLATLSNLPGLTAADFVVV